MDYLAVIPDTFADGYFVGWEVTSQIRTALYYQPIADLTCTWVDPDLTRSIKVQALDTKTWPVGNAVLDIQFVRTADGYTISTDTVQINIVHDVTVNTVV